MNFDSIKEKINIYRKKNETLDFQYTNEDISFKLSILRNYLLENEYDAFSAEINVFNGTFEYTLMNYGGNIIQHRFYEEVKVEMIIEFIENSIFLLNAPASASL